MSKDDLEPIRLVCCGLDGTVSQFADRIEVGLSCPLEDRQIVLVIKGPWKMNFISDFQRLFRQMGVVTEMEVSHE